jgi:hypothetical protein
MRKAQNKRYKDPEEKKKISKALIKLYEDPKEREKQSIAQKKKYKEKPELKEKLSKTMKKKARRGEDHGQWKQYGSRKIHNGYIIIKDPKRGFIQEHRLIMEKHLGRKLKDTEVVHHENGIRDDNQIKNLILFKNQAEHISWHKQKKKKGK